MYRYFIYLFFIIIACNHKSTTLIFGMNQMWQLDQGEQEIAISKTILANFNNVSIPTPVPFIINKYAKNNSHQIFFSINYTTNPIELKQSISNDSSILVIEKKSTYLHQLPLDIYLTKKNAKNILHAIYFDPKANVTYNITIEGDESTLKTIYNNPTYFNEKIK